MPPDPVALLRSRSYLALLVLAAIIGVPVSAVAYFFLALVSKMQGWIFTELPQGLGFRGEPLWWPTGCTLHDPIRVITRQAATTCEGDEWSRWSAATGK